MSIYEYDEEKHMRQVKEEGREEGYMAGREDGLIQGLSQGQEQGRQEKLLELVQRKLQKGKSLSVIAEELEEDVAVIEAILKIH